MFAKKKKRILQSIACLSFLCMMLLGFLQPDTYQAASSYTNAKEFYETCKSAVAGKPYRSEANAGVVYYATCAKLASSSSNLKYHTVGFDIELKGNGHSVSFTVQRSGGSMVQIGEPISSGGQEYILYAIKTDTLFDLATKANRSEATYVLNSSQIEVTMNAILTTKQGTRLSGDITENGSGGFTKWGTIYRLKDIADLNAVKSIFTGHRFLSYTNIETTLDNYKLQIQYMMNGTDSFVSNNAMAPSTSIGNNKFSLNALGVICQNGSPVITSSNILNRFNLLNPEDAKVTKTGYHLPEGKEWLYNNQTFSATASYMPTEICPAVGYGDKRIYMYANWQPNTYTVMYNANGGSGTVAPSSFTYDQQELLRENVFTRTGYSLKPGEEWNTKPDGTGTSYSSADIVSNLTSENNGNVTLYANWQPNVYEITTEKMGGTGGTDAFYQKYGVGFYKEATTLNKIAKVGVPTKVGYNFIGYYNNIYGAGSSVVKEDGAIAIDSRYYTANAIIYAMYEPKQFTITFDKQGGIGGTDSVVATYDQYLPTADAPIKTGYSFKGYYASKSFLDDELYYNSNMAANTRYLIEGDITLYANWEDDVPPKTCIEASTSSWTNIEGGIKVTADAYDLGTGLDKVELYCDGVLVASKYDLDGATELVTLEYTHTSEGAYRYKIVAYDVNGNVSESYANCKYDIKAPEGTFNVTNSDVFNFSIDVHASDFNIQ